MAHFVTITEEDDKAAAFCETPGCLWRGPWRHHEDYEDPDGAAWNSYNDARFDGDDHETGYDADEDTSDDAPCNCSNPHCQV